ncbi:nitroreductase family protein [Anaeromicrobium sediminis]|uniref:Nitroreductase domain-containing protein n=1 Tax=Anaeromicrobium sediminis TaxID=1478221 RepID=A0A267MGK3_9FIRM|nr:nitroreductase family protein [Anaeromicrobium sediminis]PAB58711.1 hypothetical protein CCE28_13655 [Anaeromicrobium sediminis]
MLDLLLKRRSIRKFKEDKVEVEKIEKIIQGALLSPSSKNKRPWEFIVVEDKEILEKLSQSKAKGIAFVKDAPLAIVVLGEKEVSDVWIEDVSIATTLIQLEAESIGLGSCWAQIRERFHDDNRSASDFIREVLNIPEDLEVECVVAIGYGDEEKRPYDLERLKYEKVHMGEYGKSFK